MLRHALALPALLGLVLLSGTGCAFVNLTVHPPNLSEASSRQANAGPPIAVVVPFADERPDPSRCGLQKNGYNMATATVYCSVKPAEFLAQHLAAELRSRGFTVHTDANASDSAALRIEGKLLQFFVEPQIGFVTVNPEADIHVKLVVTSPSGLVAERSFYVKEEEVALAALEPSFQAASDKATRKISSDMARAVKALFERYPQLSTTAAGPQS